MRDLKRYKKSLEVRVEVLSLVMEETLELQMPNTFLPVLFLQPSSIAESNHVAGCSPEHIQNCCLRVVTLLSNSNFQIIICVS